MQFTLKHHQHFPGIPSASGIACLNGRYYIAGDDASRLYILKEDFTLEKQITIPGPDVDRIPKPVKRDWESLSLINTSGVDLLLALGSGSLAPHRDAAFLFNPSTGMLELKDLCACYRELREKFDLNIEAATEMGAGLLTGNRGHLGRPENHLLYFRKPEIWEGVQEYHPCTLQFPEETLFSGISGLAYLAAKDWLILTTSAEETASVYDDGRIGESRIGIIHHASSRILQGTVVPDVWVKLEEIHPVFRGQKIESVCIRPGKDGLELLLVADNDDGGSHLFLLVQKD